MSYRPWEESAPDPETPHPITPTKPQHNARASHCNQHAEISECQYDSDEPFRKHKKKLVETKKRERHLIVYVPIKRWPTGYRAEIEEEEMKLQRKRAMKCCSQDSKKLSIPSPPILDYGRRGRYTSRVVSLIRFRSGQ
jgi:hypothetical protein